MRVALIDPSLFTLPYDTELARGLIENGHEATVYGRRPRSADGDCGAVGLIPHFYRYTENSLAERLPTKLRLALKGLDHAGSMVRLPAALRRAGTDVIHFQWLALPVVDRAFLGRLRQIAPLVLTVHDTNPFNGDPSAGLQQRGFFAGLSAFDRLIVHTRQGRDRLISAGLPDARIAIIPHGLLLAPPEAATPDRMEDTLTFLLFGKIKPYKGVDVLIDAFAALPEALRRQARIRVVGKPYMDLGPLRTRAERAGIEAQFILEPRFVADEEIPSLFAPGVVAVFPYREIEASGVLSIAQAHSRPIIASALGNFAESITDGAEGHLVPAGDVGALTAALAHMLNDRRFAARCSDRARASLDAVPSWREIGRRTADFYRVEHSSEAAAQLRPAA